MIKDVQNIDLAWLAGLIDGEGCFNYSGKHYQPRLRVVLQSRDKFVLDKICDMVGGRLYWRKPQLSWRPNCSDQWEWTEFRIIELLILCKKLYPYLVLKKSSCGNMIDYITEKIKTNKNNIRKYKTYIEEN